MKNIETNEIVSKLSMVFVLIKNDSIF